MKRIFLLSILGLSLSACSVDSNELDLNANEIQELNVTFEDCSPVTYQFGEAGYIEVNNDVKILKVRIVAKDGYSLVDTKLHIAENLQDFPVVGNGNLPPGQMSHQEPNPDSVEHIFEFDLTDYPESFFIASNSTFEKDGSAQSLWAGTPAGSKGNWSYFEYTMQECEKECTEFLGEDNTSEMLTVEQITGWEYPDLEEYVSSTFLDGASLNGTFSPTLEDIYDEWSTGDVPNGLFTSTYTVTVDGCTDSAVYGVTISRN